MGLRADWPEPRRAAIPACPRRQDHRERLRHRRIHDQVPARAQGSRGAEANGEDMRVIVVLLLLLSGNAFSQTIKVGELNSYKVFPAFLEPYKKGWELALEEI